MTIRARVAVVLQLAEAHTRTTRPKATRGGGSHAIVLFIALAACPLLALAQTTTQVTGTFGASSTTHNESLVVTFNCTGAPTCAGQFNLAEQMQNCSNVVHESNAFTMTGLNLAQSGPLQGTLTLAKANNQYTRLADGTCVVAPGATDALVPYTGTWNLATGAGTISVVGEDETFPGTFTANIAAPPPVFPMVVRATINAASATATADILFRPQDVGRQGSVFVFASAPAARVAGGLEAKAVHLGKASKADTPCVLAQMNPQGQLVAVSIAQMQAFTTGAFSAQGAAVSILNNTPTPSIAGTTFYVGYGSNSGAMLDGGIFRNAVLVPGSGACPPLPYMTALWFNPNEAGWGLNLNQQGSLMFATLFTYDSSRAPMWLVMSGGALQADGVSFTGDLFRTTGPAFNANPFTPIGLSNVTRVGSMTVSFSEANAGVLRYDVNGVQVTKSMQRQVYGTHAANCLPTAESRVSATNYQDLWWNPAESGWGVNLTHQDNTLFATLFTYEAGGNGVWLVMSGGARQQDGSYLGDLFKVSGSAFNATPFVPTSLADITLVGTMRLRFADGNNGTLTYTFNGTSVTKAITRQEFSTPVSACN